VPSSVDSVPIHQSQVSVASANLVGMSWSQK
jgi:hypothetical protein